MKLKLLMALITAVGLEAKPLTPVHTYAVGWQPVRGASSYSIFENGRQVLSAPATDKPGVLLTSSGGNAWWVVAVNGSTKSKPSNTIYL